MKISKFDISQIDDIVSMHQVEFVDYWGKEELLNSIAKSDTLFLVAEENNKILGSVFFIIGVDTADLISVVVASAERNKKIATKLLIEAERLLKKSGVNKILLEVRKSNIPAIKLYQSLGYIKIHERKKYYSNFEDAYILQKEL